MKKILVLFASILCLVFSIKASAQTGCIKYYGPGFDAVYYPTNLGTTGVFGPNYGGTPVSLPFGCWPTEPSSTLTRECTIGTVYGGLLIQNHIQCPIDTYLPFFVLLASCLGAGLVRNRMVVGFLH
ncbi:hypothetical protein SRABI27_00895 [Pedobacter sp. Bi27]|uniref:hypothetical protein n=1 Tax=Pedobacter sp. Bi27 TaxID=2822351 RepID=UPI001DD484BE|nr:hypothetical protein [Pedobacter sp. Bi27]CAH0166188.1 hypothetical protein SRABI27_00895 [Pedobacter sp. Bi27]